MISSLLEVRCWFFLWSLVFCLESFRWYCRRCSCQQTNRSQQLPCASHWSGSIVCDLCIRCLLPFSTTFVGTLVFLHLKFQTSCRFWPTRFLIGTILPFHIRDLTIAACLSRLVVSWEDAALIVRTIYLWSIMMLLRHNSLTDAHI